jgi:hypothetical protein
MEGTLVVCWSVGLFECKVYSVMNRVSCFCQCAVYSIFNGALHFASVPPSHFHAIRGDHVPVCVGITGCGIKLWERVVTSLTLLELARQSG